MSTPIQRKKEAVAVFHVACKDIRSKVTERADKETLDHMLLDLDTIIGQYRAAEGEVEAYYERYNYVDLLVRARIEKDAIHEEHARVRDLVRWYTIGLDATFSANASSGIPIKPDRNQTDVTASSKIEERQMLMNVLQGLKDDIKRVEKSIHELTVSDKTDTEVKRLMATEGGAKSKRNYEPQVEDYKTKVEWKKPPVRREDIPFEPMIHSTPLNLGGEPKGKPPELPAEYASKVEPRRVVQTVGVENETLIDLAPVFENPVKVAEPLLPEKVIHGFGNAGESRDDVPQLSVFGVDQPMKFISKIPVPKFSGDKSKFADWWAAFQACVDHPSIPPAVRMLKLQEILTGEAESCVKGLGYSQEGLDVAKERLFRKYGGTRRLLTLLCNDISKFKQVRDNNPGDLEKMVEMLDRIIVTLKSNAEGAELGNGYMYNELLRKLTAQLVSQYNRWIHDKVKEPSVMSLKEFLNQETEFMVSASEAVYGFGQADKRGRASKGSDQSRTYFTRSGAGGTGNNSNATKYKEFPKQPRVCKNCENTGHGIWECRKYKALSVPERDSRRKELHLCFKCLGPHPYDKCWRKRSCNVNGCKQAHHELLHGLPPKGNGLAVGDSPVTDSGRMAHASASTNVTTGHDRREVGTEVISFRVVPVFLSNDGRRIRVNALMDEASNRSYVTDKVAEHLHLEGQPTSVTVHAVANQFTAYKSMEVAMKLESHDRKLTTNFTALTLPEIAPGVPVTNLNRSSRGWQHLQGIVFPKPEGGKIDVLIGLDHLYLMKGEGGDVAGLDGQPIARLTPFGWTCAGDWTVREAYTFTTMVYPRNKELHRLVEKMWEIEEPERCDSYTPDERRAVEMVEKSCVKVDGRFCVGIPWRAGRPTDTNNYQQAVRRLVSTERKLIKAGPEVCQGYQKVFDDYKQDNVIAKCDPSVKFKKNVRFLAHFPVIRFLAASTKIRPVFDASEELNGVSLNDMILPGPKLQKCLVDILLGFRRNSVAICGDIMKMYLQILMDLLDQDFHMFVWRNLKQEDEPTIYKFTRIVFGGNASPFIAQFVARKNASEYVNQFPRAVKMILDRTFMDDGLDSVHTDEEGIQLIKDVTWIWGQASMQVHKWMSNSVAVLNSIPVEMRGTSLDLTKNEIPVTKALGCGWDPESDTLTYNSETKKEVAPTTKRDYLSLLATVFDPLGLVSPVVVRGKIILQRCWVAGCEWDDTLPEGLCMEIRDWVADLLGLKNIAIPRMLVPGSEFVLYLHMSADASEQAMGAVVHSVAIPPEGDVYVNVVASKSKVAPLSAINVPRSELQAALIGARLLDKVRAALEVELENCYAWTDSMNVLHWLRSMSREFKPFVQNRVAEIQRLVTAAIWRHIPTDKNPADILSRGSTTDELESSQLWRIGPDFYGMEKSEWPETPEVPVPTYDKERRKNAVVTLVAVSDTKVIEQNPAALELKETRLAPSRWSSYQKLIRATAQFLRAVQRFKGHKPESKALSAAECQSATDMIVRDSQRVEFAEEISCLLKKKAVSATSALASMNPWLDDEGVLRGNTRLSESEELPWAMKFPILIERNTDLARLIIQDIHEKSGHCSAAQTFTELVQQYWIPKGRETVRKILLECNKCKRFRTRPYQPYMAPLPQERLDKVGYPFMVVSMDFAGPFLTKAGRGKPRYKQYLCVYGCLHTRAVHLEIVTDMTTQAFLMALTRIMDRRGRPRIAYSDNGSNLVGGVNELKEFMMIVESPEFQNVVGSWKITWYFNPPAAPHFNGVHEVLVRTAKRALYKILGNAALTDEELQTATCDVERIMNNRPLVYQTAGEDGRNVLTPNHFLIGRMGYGPVEDDEADTGEQLRLRWRHVQHLVTQVWARWMREWLTSLSPRSKWLKSDRDVRVGDVVLVCEPQIARGRWPLGRITKVFPGTDGVVRVVELESRGMIMRRPVVRVCRLIDEV